MLAPLTTTVNPSLGVQRVFHAGRWWDAARHARLDLPVGTRIDGPAILEQPDTTVWLEPGFSATVDPLGNLLVRADGEGAARATAHLTRASTRATRRWSSSTCKTTFWSRTVPTHAAAP